ncbi:MAG: Gfo/Idh/MocA family oxidoreductase [Chloroflexi bacterium]|nr:Gfo/Idh/MocA family oxidoreductase [Chloroflexota bacterium]
MDKIRWGILATGNVAYNFTKALVAIPEAEVVAVASRRQETADAFADEFGIPKRYAAYEALALDPDIDIVYIATPHNLHHDNMLMCLQAGKHVLCEKSFTLNARQAEACIQLAREKRLFLMEAMWMRFFPAIAQVNAWLDDEKIGDIKLVQADFCIKIPFDAKHRVYNPATAGGALLDLGIYPISLTSMILGLENIQSVQSFAHIGPTGVDVLDSIILAYDSGASAMLSCGLQAYKPREAFIIGTAGYIKIHNIFFRPDTITLHPHGEEPQTLHLPFEGNGYVHEIREVHDCLRSDQLESQLMPLDETLAIMRLMDALRAQWGLVYPEEHT